MVGLLKKVPAYGLVFGLGTAGVIWARVAALRPDPDAERVLNSPGAESGEPPGKTGRRQR
jgi:hypothetical protein